jgi:hypothetical protein
MVRKVVATIHTGEDATTFLARQRSSHLRRIRELRTASTDSDDDTPARLVRDFVAVHLDADLRWLDGAMDRITELKENRR